MFVTYISVPKTYRQKLRLVLIQRYTPRRKLHADHCVIEFPLNLEVVLINEAIIGSLSASKGSCWLSTRSRVTPEWFTLLASKASRNLSKKSHSSY